MQRVLKRNIFAFLVMFSLFMLSAVNMAYCAHEKQTIKKVEQKRTALRKKINSLERLEKKQNSIISKKQQRLETNKKALRVSETKRKETQKKIDRLEQELTDYLKQYNKRNSELLLRIRCIYKTKRLPVLDLLVSKDVSISKFLDKIYYQNLIIKSDKKKMKKLKKEAQNIVVMKQKVEFEKRQLSKIIRDIDKENSSIKTALRQEESILKKIQKDKRAYEKSERELARQSNYLAKLISKTTKNSSVKGVSGNFILPVTGARISSKFGWRVHPIFKSKIFHTGIDYAIAYGTPIKASNSGKVIYSGWYGGYGKVVILDHGSCNGQPTTTLYAHMSRQNVSSGQSVNQGDIIGFVGSTGYSTGPHVHFEVRINGKPQNPQDFL